jgi:hypothetical protein
MNNQEYFSQDIYDFLLLLTNYEVRYLIVGGEAADGRRVVVAIHKGKNVKEGLAHKIITKEIELSLDEFFKILRGK